MDSRNILTVLIVIFVAILLYNGLYFAGFVGNFGAESAIEQLPEDPRFQLPGLEPGAVPVPRPSNAATQAAANQRCARVRRLRLPTSGSLPTGAAIRS